MLKTAFMFVAGSAALMAQTGAGAAIFADVPLPQSPSMTFASAGGLAPLPDILVLDTADLSMALPTVADWLKTPSDTPAMFRAFQPPIIITAMPEPMSWAMMLVGLGVSGWILRHRQKHLLRVSFV